MIYRIEVPDQVYSWRVEADRFEVHNGDLLIFRCGVLSSAIARGRWHRIFVPKGDQDEERGE